MYHKWKFILQNWKHTPDPCPYIRACLLSIIPLLTPRSPYPLKMLNNAIERKERVKRKKRDMSLPFTSVFWVRFLVILFITEEQTKAKNLLLMDTAARIFTHSSFHWFIRSSIHPASQPSSHPVTYLFMCPFFQERRLYVFSLTLANAPPWRKNHVAAA